MKEIVFCLDNDAHATYSNGSPAPNWGQEAAVKFETKYTDLGYLTIVQTPEKKDVNSTLLIIKCNVEIENEHIISDEEIIK
ncbi:hypothetical protein D3C74_183460 [compost metagenome]